MASGVNPRHFMAALRERRLAVGMSQQDVADVLGTTQSAISEMESGAVEPMLSKVLRYADAVGLKVAVSVAKRVEADLPSDLYLEVMECSATVREAVELAYSRGYTDGGRTGRRLCGEVDDHSAHWWPPNVGQFLCAGDGIET